jgi:hypothetical protein
MAASEQVCVEAEAKEGEEVQCKVLKYFATLTFKVSLITTCGTGGGLDAGSSPPAQLIFIISSINCPKVSSTLVFAWADTSLKPSPCSYAKANPSW